MYNKNCVEVFSINNVNITRDKEINSNYISLITIANVNCVI